MTDKQIIIDGVDVSGCEFYNKDDKTCREANGKYNIDICDFDKCENSNCYYKNWQRKEQECEELKEQLKEMNEVIRTETTRCNLVNILKTELDQLKAENEELKKTVNDLLHKPEIQDKILWKIDNEALLRSKDAYIYKLEKTLTEIKFWARELLKRTGQVVPYEIKQILQKISEVV